MKTLRGLIFLLVFGSLTSGLEAKSSGGSTADFLKLGVGGRGVAMGEAQTAAVNDVMSLYWNPAGLGSLYQQEVGFMHNNFVQGVDQDVLYYAHPSQSKGVFGAGLTLLKVGGIEGYDASDVETGNVAASDTMLTFGWAKPWDDLTWFPGLKSGVALKVLRKTLDQESAMGYMMDLGLLYDAQSEWNAGLKTGLVVQNLGTGLSYGAGRSSFPLTAKLGFSYPFFGENLTVATDLALLTDGDPYFNMGFDYRLWEILAFRLGYKGNNDLDSGLTYGFGIGHEGLHLDYAYVPFGPMGDSHRVSLGMRFGDAYRQARVTDQIDVAYKRALSRYSQGYLVDAYMQSTQILVVAPWHRPAKLLSKRIESEFKMMEDEARRGQLQSQVDEHYALGEQLFQVDDLLRARREFESILALQPDHMGAKTYLNKIDERFQGITESFYDMALKAFATQDFVQAEEYVNKALMLTPDHVEALELKSRVDDVRQKYLRAVEEQVREQKIAPLATGAQELFEQKRYEEAVVRYNEILVIDTNNAEAKRMRDLSRSLAAKDYYNRALRSAREGDFRGADALAIKALRFKSDFAEATELRSKISGELHRVDEEKSRELYRKALDFFLAGDHNRALISAQEALSLWPDNPEARRIVERLTKRSPVGE